MILWFNNKITDVRFRADPRFNLREEARIDIAKYTYASYAPLAPLVSKFIFTLEVADGFAGREAEVEDFLRSVFPADKLIIRWKQLTSLAEWREFEQEIALIDDDLIYPAGNEDHVFMDSSIDVFRRGLELISADPDPLAQMMTTDFPIFIRACQRLKNMHGYFEVSECKNYVNFLMHQSDSMRVMKKERIGWYLDRLPSPDIKIIRTESWNGLMPLPIVKLYAPTKEQCRNFDAYAFMNMDPRYISLLEIPPGFFERNITIRYGFYDIDPNCVNINPLAPTQKVTDPEHGVDYRFTLDDIPLFWKPFIKEIIVADNIDHEAMARARDRLMLASTRTAFYFSYMGWFGEDDADVPPADWINNHTLIEKY
jgi:hypothetical protein